MLEASGTLLGLSSGPLGALLGLSWALLGPSWGALGRSSGALDARKNAKKTFLLPFWCFLAAVGPVLVPLGLIFRPPGQYFSLFLALARDIPTHVPGKIVTPGFQEHVWDFLDGPSA